MDDFLSLAHDRRSIRAFAPTALAWEDVLESLRAATYAPSPGDLQPWRLILVTEKPIRERIITYCSRQGWMHGAQLFIVMVSERQRAADLYPGRGELWASQSCAAAAQNILLAAQERGLGGCWVGSFDEAEVRNILEIPDGYAPEAILAFGMPDETPEPRAVRPLDELVFFNAFGQHATDQDLYLKDYGAVMRKKRRELKERAPEMRSKAQEFAGKAKDAFTGVAQRLRKR